MVKDPYMPDASKCCFLYTVREARISAGGWGRGKDFQAGSRKGDV